MDAQLLENLLNQEESSTLDFKRDQYPFVKATDEQKSELLKDILAMANAWRQAEAHILIGVDDVRGGRSIPVGIPHAGHLLDHQLQQFVHGKTNRELAFSYKPLALVEGTEIGVITIPLQERPIYLLKDYGALKANVVYVRRGSATGEAPPDEVVRMASGTIGLGIPPMLQLGFTDVKTRETYGLHLQVECRPREIPPLESIPLLGKPPQTLYGMPLDVDLPTQNRQYYRDLAVWIRDYSHLLSVGLTVFNPATTTAEHVVVTITMESADGLTVLDADDKPPLPSRSWNMGPVPLARRYAGRVDVAKFGRRFEIRTELGNVQPGMAAWTKGSFYIGARIPQSITADVTISADNLRTPMTTKATIEIAVVLEPLQLSELISDQAAEE